MNRTDARAFTTRPSAIEVRGLTKDYGAKRAVDALTFEVPAGSVTGFLGPNGAGKSTTLRMILGLVGPTSGSATVLGRPYAALDRPVEAVGALLETSQFHPHRTGRAHLEIVAAAAGLAAHRVGEVLEQADLTAAADDRVGGYSLGMRQRLGLAAALLGNPDVLVLDEPGNGLDPAGRRWLRGLVRAHADAGGTVFVSSHLLDEMSHLADEVVVVNRGRLVAHEPIGALLARASQRVHVESPAPERLRDALAGAGVEAVVVGPRSLVAHGSGDEVGTVAADAGIPVFALQSERPSLEDVFFALTTDEDETTGAKGAVA